MRGSWSGWLETEFYLAKNAAEGAEAQFSTPSFHSGHAPRHKDAKYGRGNKKSLPEEGFGVNDGARTHDLQNHNLAF